MVKNLKQNSKVIGSETKSKDFTKLKERRGN